VALISQFSPSTPQHLPEATPVSASSPFRSIQAVTPINSQTLILASLRPTLAFPLSGRKLITWT